MSAYTKELEELIFNSKNESDLAITDIERKDEQDIDNMKTEILQIQSSIKTKQA